MTNYRYAPAAGVRKAPKDETAVRGAPGVPRALWGIERDTKIRSEAIFNGCQPRSRAQLGRYGTNIAKWVFELSPLVRFQRVTCGKKSTFGNFRVMSVTTTLEPHRTNPCFARLQETRLCPTKLFRTARQDDHRISDCKGSSFEFPAVLM